MDREEREEDDDDEESGVRDNVGATTANASVGTTSILNGQRPLCKQEEHTKEGRQQQ